MKNHPMKFSAGLYLLVSLATSAQTVTPADQKIIDKYCVKKDDSAQNGSFVSVNNKTILQCKEDNVRYFFEKTNGRLGLENSQSISEKPYEKNPELWRLATLDYLLEFVRLSDKTCEKIEIVEKLPVLRCKPKDFVLTEKFYTEFQGVVKKMYDDGATNFTNDPEKTQIGNFLIARDTPGVDTIPVQAPYSIYQTYFSQTQDNSPFPAFKPLDMPEFLSQGPYRAWQSSLNEKLKKKSADVIFAPMPKVSRYDFKFNSSKMPQPIASPAPVVELAPVAAAAEVVAVAAVAEVAEVTKVAEVVEVEKATVEIKDEKSCQDQLTAALSKVLESDKQNIIGQQYELTVMKMAALALSEESKSLEGFIKAKSEKIRKLDNGVIDEMNKVYKAHGLNEDAKAITDHLKVKAAEANYFPADKRFFNQDSSAFVLAYQKMNPDAGLKDSDVSVLWFMSKVTEKLQGLPSGKYNSSANRTNLSTRIAQYTGLARNNQGVSEKQLAGLITQQKKELDSELMAFVADFKQANATCYSELFGKENCELTVVEASLSQLLAVNSKIPVTELVPLDSSLKGGVGKTRFKIAKFAN